MADCCAVLSNIVTDLPYTQLDMNASNEIHTMATVYDNIMCGRLINYRHCTIVQISRSKTCRTPVKE